MRKTLIALIAVVMLLASASDAKAFFFRRNVVVVNNLGVASAVAVRAGGVRVAVGPRFVRVGGARFLRGGVGFRAGFGFRGRGGFVRR